jgi:hypothetical protein
VPGERAGETSGQPSGIERRVVRSGVAGEEKRTGEAASPPRSVDRTD